MAANLEPASASGSGRLLRKSKGRRSQPRPTREFDDSSAGLKALASSSAAESDATLAQWR